MIVEGERIPDSSPHNWGDSEIPLPAPSLRLQTDSVGTVERLNLDVSTMVAYVSALTNGRSNFVFHQPLLTQQAEWERARPVKPVLDQVFQGWCSANIASNSVEKVQPVGALQFEHCCYFTELEAQWNFIFKWN